MKKGKSEIKIGAILSYIVIALNIIIGIGYTPILTKALGQSEYGLYSFVSTIISYLTIMDFGFGNAIIIYTSKYRAKGEKEKEEKLHGMFFIIYTLIGVLAGIIGIFILVNINKLFGKSMTIEELKTARVLMMILTGNLIVTFPFSIFSSIITSYEKFVYQKIINIIRIVLQPIIMIVLLRFGYKSIALVTLITTLNISTLLLNATYCFKKLNIKFKFGKMDFSLLREIMAYSIWIFLNMIMDKINWSMDQTVLGITSGTVAVSVYAIAAKLDQMFTNCSTAIASVLLPKVAKMEAQKSSDKEFSNLFIRIGRIQYIVLALVISGFIIFGREFINIAWVGKDYDLSYFLGLILMIPATLALIQNIGINILQAKNMYKYRVKVLFIFALFNAGISIILAKKYGAIGAAFGTGVSIILGQCIFMNWFYYKKVNIDIPRFWKEIILITLPIIVASIISLGIKTIWNINCTAILLAQMLIYCILYAVLVYKFAMNKYEKSLITKILEKIIVKKEA